MWFSDEERWIEMVTMKFLPYFLFLSSLRNPFQFEWNFSFWRASCDSFLTGISNGFLFRPNFFCCRWISGYLWGFSLINPFNYSNNFRPLQKKEFLLGTLSAKIYIYIFFFGCEFSQIFGFQANNNTVWKFSLIALTLWPFEFQRNIHVTFLHSPRLYLL